MRKWNPVCGVSGYQNRAVTGRQIWKLKIRTTFSIERKNTNVFKKGNYDRPTTKQQTDRRGFKEVTLPITNKKKQEA